jgi:C1A family cysteine protease
MSGRFPLLFSRLLIPALFITVSFAQKGVSKTLSQVEVSSLITTLQQEVTAKGFHYTVGQTGVNAVTLDELCGFDIDKQKLSAPPPEPSSGVRLGKTLSVPAVFDWNAQGKCPPVRDQGQCGSCWAFASIGSYECALRIYLNVNTDLAEQFLLNCSTDGQGCNGGACAFNSMKAGTPLEACAPYRGVVTGCQCQKYYPIQASYSVTNDVAALKQAIYSHGPLFASVAATNAFKAYTGGLFDNNDPKAQLNHAIVIVGWSDSLQAWRIRNSWGTLWGEKGYGWIKYGCLQVGSYAAYAIPAGTSLPAAPTSLALAVASQTQINLTWKDNASNESGYYIERKAGTGAYAQVGSVGANVVVFTDKNLTANTQYYYRVRAWAGTLYSDYSNEASAVTTVVTPPSALIATAASLSQITLSWKDNASNENGYYVERKAGTGAYAQIGSVAANTVTFTDKSVSVGTAYTYRVRAFATTVTSDYSNEAQISMTFPAPSALTATVASSTQINCAWKLTSATITGIAIERKTGTGAYAQMATVGATVTAYSDKNLTAGTSYTYRVRAYVGSVYSAYSAEAAASTTKLKATDVLNPYISRTPLPMTQRTLSIINARGACVARVDIGESEQVIAAASLLRLAPGFYLARIRDGKTVVQTRFTIMSK